MNFENELNCKRWERLRGAVLARDQYLDQIKKRYGKRVGADTVHHIFPREYFPEYAFSEWKVCFRLLRHEMARALFRALFKAGRSIPARMAITAITTRSSINVKCKILFIFSPKNSAK